jgi:hypothetical protein
MAATPGFLIHPPDWRSTMRAGTSITTAPGATSRVTTAPAPIENDPGTVQIGEIAHQVQPQ